MSRNLEKLFRMLHREQVIRDAYIDSIPNDIRATFFDNQYTNSLALANDQLIDAVFAEWTESICWFLHEWKPGFEVKYPDSEPIAVRDIDHYIELLQSMEGFPKD